MSITRYDLVKDREKGLALCPRDDGGFVKYSDHEAEVAELRAQIESLMESETESVAMFRRVRDERDKLRGDVEKLEFKVKQLKDGLEKEREEQLEQCRLLGMSGEREASHLAKIDRITKRAEEAESQLRVYRDAQIGNPLAQSHSTALKWMNRALNAEAKLAKVTDLLEDYRLKDEDE